MTKKKEEIEPGKVLSAQERIIEIQSELKTGKDHNNKFGGFKYRSYPDILEAVKPLLKKYKLVLNLSDEIKKVGDRYYVMTTASLTYSDNCILKSTAYAREVENKKGFDAAQTTVATSSYARKTALSGLLLIDDTKDIDSIENGKEQPIKPQQQPKKELTPAKRKEKTRKDICNDKVHALIDHGILNELQVDELRSLRDGNNIDFYEKKIEELTPD